MKVDYVSEQPLTDEACKEATGKTISEWFEVIETGIAPDAGRRLTTHFLISDHSVDLWWATTLSVEHEKHKQAFEKDGRPKGYFICVTKTITAPVDALYTAWATTPGLETWFGNITSGAMAEGQEIVSSDGNKLSVKRVRPGKDLRFIWVRENGDESLVDVSFADKGKGKTYMLINHDRIQTREEADGLRNAWGLATAILKTVAESGQE